MDARSSVLTLSAQSLWGFYTEALKIIKFQFRSSMTPEPFLLKAAEPLGHSLDHLYTCTHYPKWTSSVPPAFTLLAYLENRPKPACLWQRLRSHSSTSSGLCSRTVTRGQRPLTPSHLSVSILRPTSSLIHSLHHLPNSTTLPLLFIYTYLLLFLL